LKFAESREDASKIGRELLVDAVLDGRIQRDGTRIRVSVQLIRTSDNVTIWTENFDDEFTNFFAVQDSISRKVVQSLALQLDEKQREKIGRHGTENAEAYQEYLRGRFFWNKRTAEGLQKAIENFNRAVELDPNFAQARSGLAETYVLVNLFGTRHDPTAFPTAKNHALRALELDGNLAEAHAALAQVKMQYDFDWPGTESEYLKAIELDPNDATVRQWYGEFLALQLRIEESISQMERARELDPTSLSTNNAMALPLLRGKQTDKALAIIGKVLEMDPNFPWALHYQCRAFLQKGEIEKAAESCQKALTASNQSIFMKSNLAAVLVRAGREPEARQILENLQDMAQTVYVSPYNFAVIYNSLGDKAAAIEYLNKAVDERDFLVPALKGDTFFTNLENDQQFAEVLRRVNL
jgi:Tfp pilus assembly protein PilF